MSAMPRGALARLRQRWELPTAARPIVAIGAGGIVNDAHLPAYAAAGLPVIGVHDVDRERASSTAARFGVGRVFERLEDAAREPGAVFDVAVPPQATLEVVDALPAGAVALLQKPLGRDLAEASSIRAACRAKRITAAVNFQLRYSPMMLALRDLIERGALGRVVELEVLVNCRMPWERWPFLESLRRVEITLHSIHYLDAIRAMLGEPSRVFARTVKHPDAPRLASSRTSAILDYGDDVRCVLSINHHHAHGQKHQRSQIRVEGTRGAAVLTMGVNFDYPRGGLDRLEVAVDSDEWTDVPLEGNWFPDAFAGPMSNLQRFAAGEDRELWTELDDAWRTMALVETLYEADARGGVPLIVDERASRSSSSGSR